MEVGIGFHHCNGLGVDGLADKEAVLLYDLETGHIGNRQNYLNEKEVWNVMLDIRFMRENAETVRQNIRNKFQDFKLPLVDKALALDAENRAIKQEVEDLRAKRNRLSKEIGKLMGTKKGAACASCERALKKVRKNIAAYCFLKEIEL